MSPLSIGSTPGGGRRRGGRLGANGSRLGMAEAALGLAITASARLLTESTLTWHGVSLVGLSARAERDGVAIAARPDRQAISTTCAGKSSTDGRRYAQCMGLCVRGRACACAGRSDGSARWLREYLAAADVDAFMIAGTLRQFGDVWGLRANGLGMTRILWLFTMVLGHSGWLSGRFCARDASMCAPGLVALIISRCCRHPAGTSRR